MTLVQMRHEAAAVAGDWGEGFADAAAGGPVVDDPTADAGVSIRGSAPPLPCSLTRRDYYKVAYDC